MKALVLGGSGSIGTAIVERLLSDGYDVILHYYRSDIEDLRENIMVKVYLLFKQI